LAKPLNLRFCPTNAGSNELSVPWRHGNMMLEVGDLRHPGLPWKKWSD